MLSPGLLTHLIRVTVQAGRSGDEELAGKTADRIAVDGDALDLLAACRVVADTALRALLALYGLPAAAAGQAWVLDDFGDVEGHPERLFAARVVTAYANHDGDIVTALVAAAAGASPMERAGSLRSPVQFAAGLEARAAHGNNLDEGT